MNEDNQQLRQYAEEGSEQAFGQLVERYLDLVYCAAMRKVGGDTHLAQEVAQTVFSNLAKKARVIPKDVVLGGWLYRDTCFTAAQAIRSERRRRVREQEALAMKALQAEPEPGWERLAPFLDEAMQRLRDHDRNAIVLRYFERRDLRSVGQALGTSEEGARKRVARAVDKLREYFHKRGVTLSAATVASLVAGHAVTAAPVGLAAAITGPALASAAMAGAGVAQLIMEVMAASKVKAGLVSVLCVAGLATPSGLYYPSEAQAQFAESGQIFAATTPLPQSTMSTFNRLSALTSLGLALTSGQAWSNSPAEPAPDLLSNLSLAAEASEPDTSLINQPGNDWSKPREVAPMVPPWTKPPKSPRSQVSGAAPVSQPITPDQAPSADRRPSTLAASATDDSGQSRPIASIPTPPTDPVVVAPEPKPADVVQPSGTPTPPPHANPPGLSWGVTLSSSGVFTMGSSNWGTFSFDAGSSSNQLNQLGGVIIYTGGGGLFFTNQFGSTNGGVWVVTFAPVVNPTPLHIARHTGQLPNPDSVTITWEADPSVLLQTTPTLTHPVWTDVPNTQGKGSVSLPVSKAGAFFRTTYNFNVTLFEPFTPHNP
jgi:RNA polymerase sigma factor (sigma-70 family)